jgi:hypothetical protein
MATPKSSGVRLPGTLKRSPAKAQRTFAKTLASAERSYGSGERAGRAAYASLKHSFKKVGDHWEPKDHKGPSDPRAEKAGPAARAGRGESFGGVDERGSSRKALYEQARSLGIAGRSAMSREELARAIAKKQR